MATKTRGGSDGQVTYWNAPTVERDGRTFVDHEAGLELARQIIREDADLMRRLADG
ncbi:hypothetical protein ACFZA2_10325 [Microbacterium sp. NPDC007973]|uniref:hypothetical protein n=1 Tax=Microbacterium sp. NPDC007973 TaxID=3364182 RepID=UPI0036E84D96